MLLVAMLALGTATFAWFTSNTTSTADGIYAKTIKASTLKISKSNMAWTTHVAYNFGASTTGDQHVMYPASYAADGNWYNCKAAAETAYDKATGNGDSGSVTNVKIAINWPTSPSAYVRLALVPCNSSGTEETNHNPSTDIYAPAADTHKQLTNASTESSNVINAPATTQITVGNGTLAAQTAAYYNLYVWFEGQDSDCKDANAGQTLDGLSFTVTGTPATE